MYTLKYEARHEELLKAKELTLKQAQELKNPDDLIHNFLLPLVVDGNEEESNTADDLITMITEWKVGQTEETYDDNDEDYLEEGEE